MRKLRENDLKRVSRLDIAFIVFFFVSFFHSVLANAFMLSLFFYWRQKAEGCIKILLLLTIRGLMSSAVAASCDPIIKWIVMLTTALWIIICTKSAEKYPENQKIINGIILSCLLFSITVAIFSFIVSSYPVISVFKMISFVLTFIAVMKGFEAIENKNNVVNYFTVILSLLFLVSIFLIPFSQFRITNDYFQGVFNHVNMLGMMTPIYIAILLYSDLIKSGFIKGLIVTSAIIMCILSGSRTGLFAAVFVIVAYIFLGSFSTGKKIGVITVVVLSIFFFLFVVQGDFWGSIQKETADFIWKTHENDLFYSRQAIFENAYDRFKKNIWLGTGFMVPYFPGAKSYLFSFDLKVEPSNLFLMLLGDTGIVGLSLFFIFIFVIIKGGKLKNIYLMIAVIMINMGEMVLFSSNNNAILLYFLIAVYLFGNRKDTADEVKCCGSNLQCRSIS